MKTKDYRQKMRIVLLLLCVLYVVPSAFSKKNRRHHHEKSVVSKYNGCKPEDKICDKRPQRYCKFKNFRYQCPRKCGECAPFEPKCPKEYKFGCCWTGEAANDIDKSNCHVCSDVNKKICKRPHIKRNCNFSHKSKITRFLCPVTCGACGDFGNDKALSPPAVCEDADQRCYKLKNPASCCKNNEILQELCRKTCGLCHPNY